MKRSLIVWFLTVCLVLTGCSTVAVTPSQTVTPADAKVSSAVVFADGEEEQPDPEFSSSVAANTERMDFTLSQPSVSSASGGHTNPSSGSSRPTVSSKDTAPSAPSQPAALTDITAGGTYTLSGTKTDGMLTVDAGTDDVRLIFDGLTLKNAKGPALYIKSAGKVRITLASGSVNTLSDGLNYNLTDGGSQINAPLFSRSDLTLDGAGTLAVTGNYKHGIVSKDDLVITDGNLQVKAVNVGIEGKDCVKIGGGSLSVTAGTDGIRSDNMEDPAKGFVYIAGGNLNVVAGNDGIQAETVLKVEGGTIHVTAGGGSGTANLPDGSYKGLKAGAEIHLLGGDFTVNAADDAVHSNGLVRVSGGSYRLRTGDEGFQATTDLTVSGGAMAISCVNNTKSNGLSYGNTVTVTGGTIAITGAKQSSKLYNSLKQGILLQEVGSKPAGTSVKLTNGAGEVLISHAGAELFEYVVLTCPKMAKGEAYTLYIGDVSDTFTAE